VMGRRTRSSETRRRARAAGEPGRQVPGPNAERRPALPLAAAPPPDTRAHERTQRDQAEERTVPSPAVATADRRACSRARDAGRGR
jgi:hypothetical protein